MGRRCRRCQPAPYSSNWIDADYAPLSFSFTVAEGFQGVLTAVDSVYSGDRFTVTDNGLVLGTAAPGALVLGRGLARQRRGDGQRAAAGQQLSPGAHLPDGAGSAGALIWLRNGLGQTVAASPGDRDDGLGVVVLRLATPLPAAGLLAALREPFAGSPAYVVASPFTRMIRAGATPNAKKSTFTRVQRTGTAQGQSARFAHAGIGGQRAEHVLGQNQPSGEPNTIRLGG